MLNTLANAFAAGIAAVFSGMARATKWGFQVARDIVRLPFDLLGGAQPMPASYEPEVSKVDILDEFEEARKRHAAIHTLDRDGVDTVLRYVKALPQARPTMDLSGVSKDVQVTLATMDDNELDALKGGGLSAVRKFVEGKASVHGVPLVTKAPLVANDEPPVGASVNERMLWKARAEAIRRMGSKDFALPGM